MNDPLVIAALCALVTAVTLAYAGWVAYRQGLHHLPWFRLASAFWFARYAFSLLSNATGQNGLAWAADHRVILVANASMTLAAILTLSDWRTANDPPRGR